LFAYCGFVALPYALVAPPPAPAVPRAPMPVPSAVAAFLSATAFAA